MTSRDAAARPVPVAGGDPDLAAVAALFADPARARVLLALADGRALPVSVLAAEAGVSAPSASAHLAKLRAGGLISMEKSGRHRYHRLAGDHVAAAIEALAGLGPTRPVRSLRAHTRATALRHARSCYDHLAGRLGVDLTAVLVERGALRPTDGNADTRRRAATRSPRRCPRTPTNSGPAPARCSPGSGSSSTPSPDPRGPGAGR